MVETAWRCNDDMGYEIHDRLRAWLSYLS